MSWSNAQDLVLIATAVIAGGAAWALSEFSHRKRDVKRSAAEAERARRSQQVKVLTELQQLVLQFYETFSHHLWASWSVNKSKKKGKKKDLELSLAEAWTQQQSLALRLFALSARVDDAKIRSGVDFLEELARNAVLTPGRHYLPGGQTTTSTSNVRDDDHNVQRSAILLNLRIGDRLLEFTGSSDSEPAATEGMEAVAA